MEVKRCSLSGNEKPLQAFGTHAARRDGYADRCFTCRRTERFKRRGIDAEYYIALLNMQDGRCAICGEPETEQYHGTGVVKSLAIDHDHIEDLHRGLLCQNCNKLLGFAQEDIEILAKAIAYLKFWHLEIPAIAAALDLEVSDG